MLTGLNCSRMNGKPHVIADLSHGPAVDFMFELTCLRVRDNAPFELGLRICLLYHGTNLTVQENCAGTKKGWVS